LDQLAPNVRIDAVILLPELRQNAILPKTAKILCVSARTFHLFLAFADKNSACSLTFFPPARASDRL
jgi:hypothetical protein